MKIEKSIFHHIFLTKKNTRTSFIILANRLQLLIHRGHFRFITHLKNHELLVASRIQESVVLRFKFCSFDYSFSSIQLNLKLY